MLSAESASVIVFVGYLLLLSFVSLKPLSLVLSIDVLSTYKHLEIIIDSGSEISLLKTNVFEELATYTITLRDSDVIVNQANEQKMELSRMIDLSIEVRGIKTYSKLYIAPDLDHVMISGEDWLKINRAQIKFHTN